MTRPIVYPNQGIWNLIKEVIQALRVLKAARASAQRQQPRANRLCKSVNTNISFKPVILHLGEKPHISLRYIQGIPLRYIQANLQSTTNVTFSAFSGQKVRAQPSLELQARQGSAIKNIGHEKLLPSLLASSITSLI